MRTPEGWPSPSECWPRVSHPDRRTARGHAVETRYSGNLLISKILETSIPESRTRTGRILAMFLLLFLKTYSYEGYWRQLD